MMIFFENIKDILFKPLPFDLHMSVLDTIIVIILSIIVIWRVSVLLCKYNSFRGLYFFVPSFWGRLILVIYMFAGNVGMLIFVNLFGVLCFDAFSLILISITTKVHLIKFKKQLLADSK